VTDKLWVELRQLVEAAWDDKQVHTTPPHDEAEWGYLADTVVDHVYAFVQKAIQR
jgi:hypothetical protein